MGAAGSKTPKSSPVKPQAAANDHDAEGADANEALLPQNQKEKELSPIRRVRLELETVFEPEIQEVVEAEGAPEKTAEELAEIRTGLQRNELFASATDEQVSFLLNGFTAIDVQKSELIVVRGEPGNHFYIVGSGAFEAKDAKGVVRQKYATGDSFGELALLYNAPRAANVTCTDAGKLWALEAGRFRYVMTQTGANVSSADAFLKSVPILGSLTDAQREALAASMEELHFEDAEYIVRMGDVRIQEIQHWID